jgi:hypothetical protein
MGSDDPREKERRKMLKRLFGNGRPLAAAALAVGLAAIAVPAFGEGGNGSSAHDQRSQRARPGALPLPPPPRLDGHLREQLAKATACLRRRDIPGVEKTAHGMFIPRKVTMTRAFCAAARECGAPPPPPRGKLLPAPIRAPGGRAKLDAAVARCLGPHRQR